ncbi:PREDICTED: translation initiation factor IF-2-like [Ceratotherium simum simum]|uniref:Translation initiation factor IF-2-like n=1 Tax=Ceratotherium simum simum TaxID=73337 RepID=A0ABM1CWX8_CERSS|nr:PREDICTED: translation initiation factor IF-2-like [Ceratotherium simum simum]
MQTRGHVRASQLARGRPRAREPLGWGAEGLRGSGTPLNQGAGPGPARAGPSRASRAGPPPSLRPAGPAPRQPPAAGPGPRRPAQQVPATADRCPAPPPCPSAAAVAPESRAPGRADKRRARGRPRPSFQDSTDLGTYQRPDSAPQPSAFSAALPTAERRRGPTASPAAAPAQPLPAPRPALLSAPGAAPRPPPHAPGPGRFRPASRRQVAPTPVRQGRSSGGAGTPALCPANQTCSLGWGSTRPSPYVTAPQPSGDPPTGLCVAAAAIQQDCDFGFSALGQGGAGDPERGGLGAGPAADGPQALAVPRARGRHVGPPGPRPGAGEAGELSGRENVEGGSVSRRETPVFSVRAEELVDTEAQPNAQVIPGRERCQSSF